jgi:DNA polymerase-3 subunit alpha
MSHADFVHLRVHSSYSLSEGAIKADKIPQLARDAGMAAVAMTDSGNLFGALEFSQACTSKGVQPILGCQIGLVRDDSPRLPPDNLVVLAMTPAGFANLQRLSSAGFMESEPGAKPQVSLARLIDYADGLFVLTGGLAGPIGRRLAEGQRDAATKLLQTLHAAFPDRIGMELQRLGLPGERSVEAGMIALADAEAIPLVATNECFFAKPEMHEAHDALLCIAEARTLAEKDRRRVSPECWFKPASVMRALFADLPEACDNTVAIAQRCAVMAEMRKPLLPVCPKVRDGQTEDETVRAMAREGLAKRLAPLDLDAAGAKTYHDRLEFELDVIAKMGFPGYFLIVADFIQWAKAQGIPVGPGRGSGAGSVVAWSLTITDVDPMKFDLLFERFLNPERISMPDFDIDFCQDRRDEVIDYVRREYGADRVAQIITFGKLQARAAVRDVGRVLGMSYGHVNKVAELIPNNPAKPVTLQEAVDGEEKLRQLRDDDEAVKRLLEIALQLEGLYRHASTHAAGLVIGDRTLTELVPVYRDAKSDFLVTQYSMKYVEQAGLVKFDFLGLTTLTILQRCVQFLKKEGIHVDIDRIPLDDPKTFAMLQRGDAGGVFQFEGQGMREVLRSMRPDRFEDLIAAVALYRPGPMASIPAYCQRKHGEAWAAPHPEIHDILSETYGLMVYQEQVMQIAQKMAGYSLGGADLLRRAMGKKIRAEMDAQQKIFLDGAMARGIDEAKAIEVFELMSKFADYGFNKCHATPYALLSYQTAWVKANHPEAFIAGCMSLGLNNTDRLAALRQEATRMGVKLLPPDINRSGADFMLERDTNGKTAVRYALAAVKRVGMAAMQAVVATRGMSGFEDLADFAERVDPKQLNKAQIENLVRAGAFDRIEANRARAFTAAETILRRAQATAEASGSGQIGLFGKSNQAEPLRLTDMPDWAPMDRLAFEAEAIGFHLTAHPLDAYATVLRRMQVVASTSMEARAQGGDARVKLAGSVINSKERITRSGSRMAWVRMSDAGGTFEVTFFSETLGKCRDLLVAGTSILVTADLHLEGETLRITAVDAQSLDQASQQAGTGIRIWLARTEAVPHIKQLLDNQGQGRGRVTLIPRIGSDQEVEITLQRTYNISPRLTQALKSLQGVDRIEDA